MNDIDATEAMTAQLAALAAIESQAGGNTVNLSELLDGLPVLPAFGLLVAVAAQQIAQFDPEARAQYFARCRDEILSGATTPEEYR